MNAVKLISFDKEMKFVIGDTDYNVVWSLEEQNEETGSIHQDETNNESIEEGKGLEDYNKKQENRENNVNIEESETIRGEEHLLVNTLRILY